MTDPARQLVPEVEGVLDLHKAVRTVEATIAQLTDQLARHEEQIDELRWQLWFAKLSRKKRLSLAEVARARGLDNPTSFEAARAVVWGDHALAQFTPEERAAFETGEDLRAATVLTSADQLDEWLREEE